MKKFKHILVCGLAVVASAVAVQAQTRTHLKLERLAYAHLSIPKATFSLPTSGNGEVK